MDANGTRFKVLLGEADWGRCSSQGTSLAELWSTPSEIDVTQGTRWDERRHELTLAALPWTFPKPVGQARLRQGDRRGAAIDRYGNWYWIDADESGIQVLSSGSNLTSRFWPDPSRAELKATPASDAFGAAKAAAKADPGGLRGLAVTDDHYLLVGTLRPGGLLAFDLSTGGPPLQVAWPANIPFAPLNIAPRSGGGAFVLDRAEGSGGPRVWRLDRHFMVEPLRQGPPVVDTPPTFAPADGSPWTASPEPAHRLTLSDAAPLAGDPVAIGLAGDIVVVLDRLPGEAGSVVRLFTTDLQELADSPRELLGLGRPLVVHDIAVVSNRNRNLGEPHGQLYVVDEQGDQAYRFPIQPIGGPLTVAAEYLPMRLFGGRGLIATPTGAAYDSADRWVRLVPQRRVRFAERATLETEVLDSGEHGCVWHRLLLDGSLTSEATVRVWSAAADDSAGLDDPVWRPEPSPYRRAIGPERAFLPVPADAGYGTYETLFQAARGRYLRLRLELAGNRQTSPSIRSLRIYFPRFSYLEHYLPGVYRAEPTSAAFVDAFLANFEGTYTEIEDRIAAAEVLFDPRTAPPDALDWLAGWFDIVIDAGWDEERRRLLIRHAMDLFRWRGTDRGIKLALGLALLACPDERLFARGGNEPGGIRIVERYQTKRGPAAVFGDPIAESLPRLARGAPRWTPGDGAQALHERYGAYLDGIASRGLIAQPAAAERKFPLAAPAGDWRAAWRTFAGQVLGFVPAATAADQPRWATFLRHRYRTIDALNAAHNRMGSQALASFDDAPLPAALPADGAALADWFAFESVVLRGIAAAHQFRVMLPVPVGRAAPGSIVRASDVRDRLAEQTRVARLVELEKPAHTTFDVLSFWLAFRVGEARLGRDTLIDLGSRSPDLRPPAVLGSMHIGESVLTSAMADLPDRPAVFSGSVDAATRHVGRRTDG